MRKTYQINTFDDGNEKYKMYPNHWFVIDSMFDGGKVTLQNQAHPEIIIKSISSWKIIN